MTSSANLARDAQSSLKRTRDLISQGIQQSEDLGSNLRLQTDELRKILGLHGSVTEQALIGRGNLRALATRAFWDRYIYHAAFLFYLAVVFYIQSRRYGNLFYRLWDWTCWCSSWLFAYLPGFQLVCSNYSVYYNSPKVTFEQDEYTADDVDWDALATGKPEL